MLDLCFKTTWKSATQFPNFSTKIMIWFVVLQSLLYFPNRCGPLDRSYRAKSVQKNQIQVYSLKSYRKFK